MIKAVHVSCVDGYRANILTVMHLRKLEHIPKIYLASAINIASDSVGQFIVSVATIVVTKKFFIERI